MASDTPHGPSRGFACLPRSLPKRLYRLIPSISLLKAPEGVPRTGRPCKRCLGSSWEAAKLRLRHLRNRGPVKTSTGVGTEPPPCRDAVVMATAPTEDGSPTLTSSSSVWRSEDDCTKSSSSVSRRPPRYHRGRHSSGSQDAARPRSCATNGEAVESSHLLRERRVDQTVQTDEVHDEMMEQSYVVLVDAYCSYRASVSDRMNRLGSKWAEATARGLLGRVWAAWRQLCLLEEMKRVTQDLTRQHAQKEQDLRQVIEQLRRASSVRQGPVGISEETVHRDRPPFMTATPIRSPVRPSTGKQPDPNTSGQQPQGQSGGIVELYEGPVFVPASPRRGPAVVTRPSPSMVDASRVPWADRLDNTMASGGNHAVEWAPPQQQSSVQGHRSDVAMGSLAPPAATAAPQGGVRPYYNEVLVRKVLEKGATVRGRLGAEGLQQKLDALKRLEEAVFYQAQARRQSTSLKAT